MDIVGAVIFFVAIFFLSLDLRKSLNRIASALERTADQRDGVSSPPS